MPTTGGCQVNAIGLPGSGHWRPAGYAAELNYALRHTSHWNDRLQQRQGNSHWKKLSKSPDAIRTPQRIHLVTGLLVPEKQKPHEERRACTYATFL